MGELQRSESGIALLVTILTVLLLSALVAAVVVLSSTESLIASSFRGSREAFYAAEAVGEWAVAALSALTDEWTSVANGLVASPFVDGPATGTRTMSGEVVVDLTAIAAANPGWRLFAYGALGDLLQSSRASQFYTVSLVAQDAASLDRMKIRAMVFGPRGGRRALELGISRSARGVHVLSWAELR
jgi:Tfp pilus assembly protein PilX